MAVDRLQGGGSRSSSRRSGRQPKKENWEGLEGLWTEEEAEMVRMEVLRVAGSKDKRVVTKKEWDKITSTPIRTKVQYYTVPEKSGPGWTLLEWVFESCLKDATLPRCYDYCW
eukprot:Selendium_serpulae@DN10586_c1_g1_i1.p2